MAAAPTDNQNRCFRHTRLLSLRFTRLLRLFSASEFDSPLQIELVEICLDDPSSHWRDYEALSYVWGSPSGSEEISCNGQLLLVTPNCESALRHLRLKDRDRMLWIDSISIDQENTVEARLERSAQVALMGEIYSKASRTLCWLGRGETYTSEVMHHLDRIGVCPSERGFRKLSHIEDRLRVAGALDRDTSCLDHIFCHLWHSRIWTVQEVAFSKDCIIVCGSSSIPWKNYFKAAKFLIFDRFIENLELQASRNMVSIDVRNVLRNYILDPTSIEGLGEEEVLDEQDQRVTFLSSCLTDINQLRSTDPKDKIYGLHALYTKLGVSLPAVDYTLSTASVYTGAAIAMICWSRSLKVLGDACSINRDPSLPSWVPDWNDPDARMSVPSIIPNLRSFAAYSEAESLSPGPGKLRTAGRIVGRLVHSPKYAVMRPFPTRSNTVELDILSSAEDQPVDDVEFLRLLIDKIRFLRELIRTIEAHAHFFEGADMIDVLHDMLTLGRRSLRDDLVEVFVDLLAYPNSRCDLAFGSSLAAVWMAKDSANSAHWSSELLHCSTIVASLLSNSLGADGSDLASHADIVELIKEVSENLGDYKVIFAESKLTASRTLGLAFQAVNTGDFVILLDGADWPLILRPVGTEWLSLGPAFLPNITDDKGLYGGEIEQPIYKNDFVLI